MRRIREALRLHLQGGLSYNAVVRVLKISKSVVGKYVSLARVAGVPAIHLLGDEADALDAEWLADDPGVALVAGADAAAAAAQAVRTLSSSADPRARWDGAAFVEALAPLLSPAPRLAGP